MKVQEGGYEIVIAQWVALSSTFVPSAVQRILISLSFSFTFDVGFWILESIEWSSKCLGILVLIACSGQS